MDETMTNKTLFDFFGSDAEFEHIGMAVKSIESIDRTITKICDPIQRVNVAFIRVNGIELELVEPAGDDSPVKGVLEKGQSFYHLCFRVKNIENAIAHARKKGFHCIAKPVSAAAFNDRKIAWLYNINFGLFELVEA